MQKGVSFSALIIVFIVILTACEESKSRRGTIQDDDKIAENDVDIDQNDGVDKDADNIVTPEIDSQDSDTEISDDVIPDNTILDDNETPEIDNEVEDADNYVPVDLCQINTDCAWQYVCDTFADPNNCIKFGTCDNDYDCTNMQTCVVKEHWKECATNTSPKFCTTDEDCGVGEFCQTDAILKICRSKNICSDDSQCPEKYECILQDEYYQCVDTSPCELDTDCKFGYKCEIKTPENECVYASECVSDEDCNALSACIVEGNWTVCKLAGGGFCTNDAACELSEYCDLQLGLAGVCKSRNQCYQDADCNDSRLKCENNGVYNECVPINANWCLLDAMCDEGWYCLDNECRPPYYNECTEIAGEWKVWFSGLSAVTFNQDEVYEFVPTDGCNGKILKDGSDTFNSFAQTSAANYDLNFYLIYTCTAKIVLGNLMNISCADGDAQLGRF